jgi:hypothetical protein
VATPKLDLLIRNHFYKWFVVIKSRGIFITFDFSSAGHLAEVKLLLLYINASCYAEELVSVPALCKHENDLLY